MDASSAKHLFQKRNEKIDWRKLASIDVEKIAREVDIDAIQENIVNVTYCNVEQELGYHGLDANVIKLFRLAQLTIEYLLHTQEFLQQCLSDKDRKLVSYNEKLNSSESRCGVVSDELSKKKESYKDLKKELQKAKKLIGDYQLMVHSGASGLYKCTICTKSFVTEYYLKSHLERRHSAEAKQIFPAPQAPATVSTIQDEIFVNELNVIKSRLKATEDELRREHENVHQLNLKEGERNRELLEILKQQELQKNGEKEQIKIELVSYKNMMMKELKETQRENEELKKNIHSLHESTEVWKKSTLGNLQDDGTSNKEYEDIGAQIKELKRQLAETSKENKELKRQPIKTEELKNAVQKLTETSKENNELKNAVQKWKAANKKLIKDDNKYRELYAKVQELESSFQTQLDSLCNKSESQFEETKDLCKEYVRNNINNVSSMYVSDIVDGKKPLITTVDVSLWVSTNTSIMNCYRVSQKTSHAKGDWNDLFSFTAVLAPHKSFDQPIYVFTCGGSPYWRQYISLFDQPPTPNYKKELTFYGSAGKVADTTKLFILDIGGAAVVRSMLSKKENVQGWRGKGEYFYAVLPKTKSLFNRSSTNNSDVFQSVSDDEVSLSSLTGTDIAKDNLAEALKLSRENLNTLDDQNINKDMSTDKVGEFQNENDTKYREAEKVENTMHDINEIVQEEKNEHEMFAGTSSSSFLDATLPEEGQFYPFPDNLLAIARYNHTPEMVNAQREEIITIIKDNLIKRGVDIENQHMLSHVFASKMRNHEKELRLIEKQNPGCIERRKRILTSIENYATGESVQPKKGKLSEKSKSIDNIVNGKTSVRFADEVTPIKKHIDRIPPTAVTSTPKIQPPDFSGNSDGDSESESEWDSEELANQIAQSQDNRTSLEIENDYVDNFGSKGVQSPRVASEEAVDRPASSTNNNNGNAAEESDSSSDWDSDELSIKHLDGSEEPYNPKMRPPTGDNVKKLTASLESTLGSRDPNKKVAGGVDLHPVEL